MEDYDVFLEMKNVEDLKVIAIVEDDEEFVTNELLHIENLEIIPIRFTYDLKNFSEDYIERTSKLFAYYYNNKNDIENEKIRLKKHFIHYRRTPFLAYIPNVHENKELILIFKKLDIEVFFDKRNILEKIIGDKKNGQF